MRMACRPRQHGARYAEIIVLPWRATVHDPALAHFGLKSHELLISASGRWSVDNSDLTRLQQRMIKFEEIGAANDINQHRRMFDRAPLKIHAIAVAADLKANHARTERLVHHLCITRVVAEICDNEIGAIIAAINHCELARTRTSIKPWPELVGLLNPNWARVEWREPADDSCRTIAAASHIMRDDKRPETAPSLGIISIKPHGIPPVGLRCWKG